METDKKLSNKLFVILGGDKCYWKKAGRKLCIPVCVCRNIGILNRIVREGLIGMSKA